MGKKKTEPVATEPVATEPVATEPVATNESIEDAVEGLADAGVVAPEKNSVKVFDENGVYIREYSSETHGDTYKELAEQFISHHKGYVIK